MNKNQITFFAGLVLILIFAVLMDLAFDNARSKYAQTFDFQLLRIMFELRPFALVILYITFFIIGLPIITSNYSYRLPTWIMIVFGLVIVIPMTFPLRWPFSGILMRQLDPIVSSPMGATLHFGAILTALGFYRLGRSFVPKKHE